MAHGNVSDIVFFSLLVIVVQWWFFTRTLFTDYFFMSKQFDADMGGLDQLIALGGTLLLMIGGIFSGVKWNPANGKMAGVGGLVSACYISYSTFTEEEEGFHLRPFYVYAAVITLGSVHILAFPSNPLPPKTQNNHGNYSDRIAACMLLVAVNLLGNPDHLRGEFLGGFQPLLKRRPCRDTRMMIKFLGCEFMMLALMLSGVKWNPINGKLAGLVGFIGCAFAVYFQLSWDDFAFILRVQYLYIALVFSGALHIFAFPSNPLPSKEPRSGKDQGTGRDRVELRGVASDDARARGARARGAFVDDDL